MANLRSIEGCLQETIARIRPIETIRDICYELRTYTLKAGTLGDVVKAASTVSRDIRGDNFGKLEGYWFTEIGPLNQVLHMWSYNDFDERTKLRAELAKNPRWSSEYLPLIRPILVRQDIRLLNAVRPPVAPASSGNVYELSNYRAKPVGAAKQWLDAFTAVLPAREKYSKIVGALADRSRPAQRGLPHLGLSEPERPRRSPRRLAERSGLEGISGQGPGVPRRDALDRHAAGAALAVEVARVQRDFSLPDEMNRAARSGAREVARDQRRMDHRHHRIVRPQRDQHVADRKAAAPDRVDHGMIGACGGIGRGDGGIGAEMPRQIERELHARREFREALVDAELEEEGAVSDAAARCRTRPACRRRAASRSRNCRSRQAPRWRGG